MVLMLRRLNSPLHTVEYYIRCNFSMMVKCANDGIFQANDGKMLVYDVEMVVNDGEMSV